MVIMSLIYHQFFALSRSVIDPFTGLCYLGSPSLGAQLQTVKFQKKVQKQLLDWYNLNHRPLPWRADRDPYRIWISESMLQQTTTTAVIPFFERFIGRFPTLAELAEAPQEAVVEAWAGLGYYSRARNLHKAAKLIHGMGSFPGTADELIQLPGIGPYTSRSVASIAFGESVGVLDGNVIRVLSRFFNLTLQWWKTKPRKELQALADQAVANFPSERINQALMELGATICTPTSPKCSQCPWLKNCQGYAADTHKDLPLSKPKRASEIWLWSPVLVQRRGRVAICKNNYAPFLKDQWFLPGASRQLKAQPKVFDFRHAITHHKIFVKTNYNKEDLSDWRDRADIKWVRPDELTQWSPSSLLQKVVRQLEG